MYKCGICPTLISFFIINRLTHFIFTKVRYFSIFLICFAATSKSPLRINYALSFFLLHFFSLTHFILILSINLIHRLRFCCCYYFRSPFQINRLKYLQFKVLNIQTICCSFVHSQWFDHISFWWCCFSMYLFYFSSHSLFFHSFLFHFYWWVYVAIAQGVEKWKMILII